MPRKPGLKRPSDHYKKWFDPTVLLLAHLSLFPLWLLLWLVIPMLIWLDDRGPIFYTQQRAGREGRPFMVRKFRTMVPHASHMGPNWTTQGDVRLTRVGRVLRRTALDELPEIMSILKGHMSLVGPRALAVEEHAELERQIPGFGQRLQALPGLTGLAQLYDRQDDGEEKFRYDLEYLRRMSPWLDSKLLLLSVRNTFIARWDLRVGKPAAPATQTDSSYDSDEKEGGNGDYGTHRVGSDRRE